MEKVGIEIRHGRPDEIREIMAVYDAARGFMRASGNMNQWINGYPSDDDILKDISAGHNYVGIDSEGRIVVSFAFIIGNDPTYTYIEDGQWLNDNPYGTIHRIASNGLYRGMLERSVEFCFSLTQDIRIDTHRDNKPMLDALQRLGFKRCGMIYCRDGSPREAFQKHII